MGRLLVLVALLGVMLLLRSLRIDDGLQPHDPFILAAIGFVVLASYTAAEVGSDFKLPRVSGYIAAGVLLGPSVFDVLSARVVEEMTMFNTLALGLIATGAGLELELKSLGKLWKTLSATVAAKVVLAGGLVFAVFYGVQNMVAPLSLADNAQIISVGLVLGTVAVGTSPAIVLAVINELGARGRVAELALGAAVIKDFVLVVLLAISIAIGSSLMGGSGGHGEGSVAMTVATELLGSILVGGLVGAVIILYVRFVASEMLLFVAATVLAVAEISRILHLDLLLVFIASGFVVRNFSRVWHAVHEALETVSLPVFVVFFTIAGARIDLAVTYRMLPFAILLAAVRALGFFGATQLGGYVGGDSFRTNNRALQAYLPQAGVTLGLLGLAAEGLPAIAEPLLSLGVAVVAVNLLVGPVTLRRSLQAETDEAADQAGGSGADTEPPAGDGPVGDPSEPAPQVQMAPVTASELDFGDAALADVAHSLEAGLRRLIDQTVRASVGQHVRHLELQLTELLAERDEHVALSRLHTWAREQKPEELVQLAAELARNFYAQADKRIGRLSAELVVPCPPALWTAEPGESRRVRFRKFRVRLTARFRRRLRERHVPLRLAAHYALSPRLSMLAVQLLSTMCRTHGRILTDLRRRVLGQLTQDELPMELQAHLQHMESDFRSDALVALGRGLSEFADIVRVIDSAASPLRSLRYSTVEPEVRAQVSALGADPQDWATALSAVQEGLLLNTSIARVRRAAEGALEREVLMPLAEAADVLSKTVNSVRAALVEAKEAVQSDEPPNYGVLRQCSARLLELRELRERDSAGDIATFRAAAALHAANVELRQHVDSLPGQLRIPTQWEAIRFLAEPRSLSARTVQLRSEARRTLLLEMMPTIDAEGTRAAGAVQDLDMRRSESLEMAISALDAYIAEDLDRDSCGETLDRALDHLVLGEGDTHAQLRQAHSDIEQELHGAIDRLTELNARGVRDALPFVARDIAPLQRLRDQLRAARERLRLQWDRLRAARRSVLGSALTQHLTTNIDGLHGLSELIRTPVEPLPPVYARLFRLEPLRDLRLSAAREAELSSLLAAERTWLAGGPSSVLISGDPGSGCTTLLNLAQAEMVAPRLIRPEPVVAPRDLGLVAGLAYDLRRKATRKDVVAGLTTDKTVVMIDDLGHWLPAGAEALSAARDFLDLVVRTQGEVCWVVTVKRQWLSLIGDGLPITDVFSRHIELQPLDVAGVRRVIETRHALSGLPLMHSQGRLSRLLGRIREGSSADLEFRLLHSVCAGNLQAALAAWARAVTVSDNAVRVHIHRFLMEQLPALSGVEAEVLALLVQLIRFGPQDVRRLAEGLGLTRQEVLRRVQALDNTGILVRSGKQLFGLHPQHRFRLVTRLPLEARRRSH